MQVEMLSRTDRIKTLKDSPAADILVDEVRLIGGRVLIAYEDIAAGEDGMFIYAAPLVRADKAAVAIAAGEIAYWDDGAKVFTNVSNAGANTKCGMFVADALAGDAKADLDLDNGVNL